MADVTTRLITDDGMEVSASLPVIISASRSTDIPAYYADWFFERLKKGYVRWINPYNNKSYYISLQHTKFIVFWTKNPVSILPYLNRHEINGIRYYILFTLNDYEKEEFEPNIPKLKQRIEAFKHLSLLLGKDRVIWRFDPILKSGSTGVLEILTRIRNIGDEIFPYTRKLVFSFIDMKYAKVRRQTSPYNISQFSSEEKQEIISGLITNNKKWNLTLASCADETINQPEIIHNSCIDGELIRSICFDDPDMMRYLEKFGRKDRGQRSACLCIKSKDIGQYDTCPAGCVYCYASDHEKAKINYSIFLNPGKNDTITGLTPQLPVSNQQHNNTLLPYEF